MISRVGIDRLKTWTGNFFKGFFFQKIGGEVIEIKEKVSPRSSKMKENLLNW